MENDFLSQEEKTLIEKALSCNLSQGFYATWAVVLLGVPLGILLLSIGIAKDNSSLTHGGVVELIVVPIIAGARYHILRLYGIIQKTCSKKSISNHLSLMTGAQEPLSKKTMNTPE